MPALTRACLLLCLLLSACGSAAPAQPTAEPTPVPMPLPTEPIEVTIAPEPTSEPESIEVTIAPEPTSTPVPELPTIAPEPTAAPVEATAEPTPREPPRVPALAAPSFNNCQDDPNAGNAANYPVLIARVDKSGEVVSLQNVSPDAVSLDGWNMCSIRGNQQVPIGGEIAPGETRQFPSADAPIWSNSDPDNGALYNDQGQLVSYWVDR